MSGGLLAGLISAGGLLFVALGNLFDIGNWYGIIIGASVVVTVIFNPEGLVGPVHAALHFRCFEMRVDFLRDAHKLAGAFKVCDTPREIAITHIVSTASVTGA